MSAKIGPWNNILVIQVKLQSSNDSKAFIILVLGKEPS